MKQILIDGVQDYYYVTEEGKIYSFFKGKKKLRLVEIDEDGYEKIALSCGRRHALKKFFVHRLVAMFYIDNPDNLPVINHKDGDKRNNHYTNLEWTTVQDNTIHAYNNGLINIVSGGKHHHSSITDELAKTIYEDYLYNGLRNCEAVKKYGISRQVASSILCKKHYKEALSEYPDLHNPK